MPLLTKINSIKNLAVFLDFRWDSEVEPFRQFNLIFGWNGSGKTALSRLFDSLQTGKHQYFPNLEYRVTLDGNQYSHADALPVSIRVFNCDYVEKNIQILQGSTAPIFLLGEKSQEAMKQILADERALHGDPSNPTIPGKLAVRQEAVRQKEAVQSQLLEDFSSIAKTIGAAISAGSATRTFRRPDAISAFNALEKPERLTDDQLGECTSTLKQVVEPSLQPISIPTVRAANQSQELSIGLQTTVARAVEVLATQVQLVAIERLVQHKDLAAWVEQGLQLRKLHASKDCEFCLQTPPADRLKSLDDHFNDADRRLKQEIDSVQSDIRGIRDQVVRIDPPNEARLYKLFRDEYVAANRRFQAEKLGIVAELDKISAKLEEKRGESTKKIEAAIRVDTGLMAQSIVDLNAQISKHNVLAGNLESAQSAASKRIEIHYLSTIYEPIVARRKQVDALTEQIRIAEHGDPSIEGDIGIDALQARITANRAKVSSAHKSCDQLNATLRSYFGRDELSYRVETNEAGEAVGYSLWRGDEPAKLVSEGELTAIAFAHFTTRLSEQGFSVKDGIVVLDDPISSLDSAVLYRVCAAIQKHLTSASQLFVLTHNMEFFNQLKKWFRNDPAIRGEDVVDEKGANYRLLMIQSRYDGRLKRRIASISDLDPMLRDHETEYHYLFKKLEMFEEDNPPDQPLLMRGIYDYPNVARKLLECYLAFRVPKRGNLFTRMQELKSLNKEVTSEDVNLVYNFINSNSHLDTKTGLLEFDATLALTGPIAIRKVLWLIEASDEKHYKAMQKAIKKE